MFRESIREQWIRFYGNAEFSGIVYQNAGLARDPPPNISGDETITRFYGKKAVDIRMRTSKKNEAGFSTGLMSGTSIAKRETQLEAAIHTAI